MEFFSLSGPLSLLFVFLLLPEIGVAAFVVKWSNGHSFPQFQSNLSAVILYS